MGKQILGLTVNGRSYRTAARPYDVLLDVIRENLNLTGTKRGCDMGTCGCCTVIIEGKPILSCLTLAAQVEDKKITTIEGIRENGHLHPLQEAFADFGGSQCGFCTPGIIMAAKAMLDRNPRPDDAQLREGISGNLCRCTGWIKIFEAVKHAATEVAKRNAPNE
ncbi:MAG: (2Fe-2S)-binding protein [Planctomycetota bacterium]|nr:(2Fe-2S)-binding protein [Planctomycetota bacterium]